MGSAVEKSPVSQDINVSFSKPYTTSMPSNPCKRNGKSSMQVCE